VRFEDFYAVRMLILLFWVLTPWRLVGRWQRYGGTLLDMCPRRQNPKEHDHKESIVSGVLGFNLALNMVVYQLLSALCNGSDLEIFAA
jgi:hypothetical protein